MICTFFGHRDASEKLIPVLKETIKQLISEGVTHFYVGNNGNFDYMVQSVLLELSNLDEKIFDEDKLEDDVSLFIKKLHPLIETTNNTLKIFLIFLFINNNPYND